ncbi:TPA: restriction endonuclease subunit S [Campylobacter lari]|uniref:restriction endonuclease subunit S n=1 Tax=Campylobacter sp. IFREMER_LSEM_CL1890 TaxID=2911615 RepID=UPI001418DEC4|nr:restriction endonuclease subunit S [Campylobacter sp. IFREMER_LSEM_CL1890]EDP6879965.1 restriction endonuclease subunit S [Campylobacter lari]MCV3409396.1 restriction endonuclease subunit S [Campylobacter sp. IFREMER_LSEM_CL1890]HEC1797197.1 restriction endonuclease subunit S [Campylobacter lari]
MNNWKKCKLEDAPLDFIDGDRGKNYPKQNEFYSNEYCLFLSTKNIRENGFDFSECQFITKEKDEILKKGKLKINDLVLTTRGTIGNLALYKENIPYKNIRINSGMLIIRPNNEELDSRYAFYLFKNLKDEFDNFVSGSAQPQLPIRDLKEVEILLPPLEEQKQIATILNSIDDKIELLHEQNKTLEELAQTLFRHYFIENPNPSWQEKPLKDVCMILNGYAFKSKEYSQNGTKIVRTTNFKNGFIDNKDVIYIDNLENQYDKYLLRKNDFLLVMVGASLGNYVVVTSNVLPALQNQNMWNFRALEGVSQHYLNYALRDIIKESVYGASGSAREFFQKNQFYEKNILVPSFEIMNKFEEEISGFYDKLNENLEQIQTLENMRDILIPKLLNGEIRSK